MDGRDNKLIREEGTEIGSIKISDEVVAVIAGLAASEIPGVAGMSGTLAGIAEKLGMKSMAKGVKVEVGERETAIDLYIIVEYGVRIPDVASEVQQAVKKAVESMTGLTVVEVNVHVQGVHFPAEGKEEEIRVK